jgi:hypothetical protein
MTPRTEHRHLISIWFFIGLLLSVYGVLILGSGIYELGKPSDVVLANLHPAIWWGALMLVLGLIYTLRFRPGKE